MDEQAAGRAPSEVLEPRDSAAASGAETPRILGWLQGARPGPTLLCIAGLHGNEPAGVRALERLFQRLAGDEAHLRGAAVGLAGNRSALRSGCRFLVTDLNRTWLPERIAYVRGRPAEMSPEELELQELDVELRRVLDGAREQIFVLDLHTTSGPGPAFAVLEDTLPNRAFAQSFPVPLVLGLEEELPGTVTHYLASQGATTLGFEAGQHADPRAVDRAEAAVWIALEACGILAAGSRPEVGAARRLLSEESGRLPRTVAVRHRHAISHSDRFAMDPGFVSFQPIIAGQIIGRDLGGPVTATERGLILMPLYQDQGEDGFFLVRRVLPVWLRISAVVRRLRLERFLHLLPGVEPHPELADRFIVDRRVARWLALELFHLLGFRRRGPKGRVVVMARRSFDQAPRRLPGPLAR